MCELNLDKLYCLIKLRRHSFKLCQSFYWEAFTYFGLLIHHSSFCGPNSTLKPVGESFLILQQLWSFWNSPKLDLEHRSPLVAWSDSCFYGIFYRLQAWRSILGLIWFFSTCHTLSDQLTDHSSCLWEAFAGRFQLRMIGHRFYSHPDWIPAVCMAKLQLG